MRRDSRRSMLALVLVLALVAALVVIFTSPRPPVDCSAGSLDAAVAAGPVPVRNPSAPLEARVGTWNALASNTQQQTVDGVVALTNSADVIGLQELSRADSRRAVSEALQQQGWVMTDDPSSTPVAWRASRFIVLAQGYQTTFDVERIEDGASGTSVGPQGIQWTQLQDRRTGAAFSVVNQHIVSAIDRDGRPDTRSPRRLALYERQMDAVLSLASKLRPYGPVALTGDYTIDATADQQVKDPQFPYARFGAAGIVSNWSQLGTPTRGTGVGGRTVDYVWLTGDTGPFVDQQILPNHGSDHSPVVASLTKVTSGSSPTATPAAARPLPTSISVQVDGVTVRLDAEQIEVAAAAIVEGKALGIPQRGWVVALAAAGAESGITNPDYGDRDSVGPWQMRPSAGWGTVEQIRDLQLGAQAFYGMAPHTNNPGLTDIQGWEQMTIAQAAQAVEVSAFPDAYTKWEAAARTIVARLAGTGTAGAGCEDAVSLDGDCPTTDLPAEDVLTPDGLLVLRCVAAQFPSVDDIGTYVGHQPDQTRAVDVMIPGWQTSSGKALGNQIAAWIRSHGRELGVQYVIWDGRIWNVERDSDGWRVYFAVGSSDPNQSHANHVHVSVYGNQGTGPAGSSGLIQAGAWNAPVGAAARIGCGYGCYSGHTGQDYPAPVGTPVYAVNAGTVIRSESITSSGNCPTLPICGGTRISYGNLIVIRLAGGGDTTAWSAHLSARRVQVGQTVQAGQVIGTVGYEGHVIPQGPAGAHLHFEIRQDGTPVDPLPYLNSKGL